MSVTLDVWRITSARLPAALWQVATLPRRTRDARFIKLLGTGQGSRFGATSVDLRRWAALTVWRDEPRPFPGFDRAASAHCRLLLEPIRSRGAWSRRHPFDEKGTQKATNNQNPILVLTRARIRPSRMVTFWRAIAPVGHRVADAPGLLAAFGIGEAPVGVQGTVSIWAGPRDVAAFAYRTAEHASVVAQTPRQGWYAEELFARLSVLDVVGDREVLGWNAERA